MRIRVNTVASVLALLVSACGGGEAADTPPTAGLDGPDRALDWSPTEIYAVGGLDAPTWAEFGRIDDVGFDGAGNLYLLDGLTSTITQLSPGGEFMRTIGGPGEGPGELNRPLGMEVFPDGRIVLSDLGHRGFVLFGPDGEWIENVPVDMAGEGLPIGDFQLHPEGDAVIATAGFRMSVSPGGAEATTPPGRPIHRYSLDPDSAGRDVFHAWDPPEPPEGDSEISGGDGGRQMVIRMGRIQAFEPGLEFGVLPDGRIAVADSSTWRIELVDPTTGDVVGEVSRPVPPTPVTDAIRQAERDHRTAEAAESGGLRVRGGDGVSFEGEAVRRMMMERIENMAFYPEIPVISDLAVDPEGRIWVERNSGVPGEDGPTDLVTAEGSYIGTLPADGLRIPDAFGPGGLIAVIEEDEFDVQTIRVMRVPVD